LTLNPPELDECREYARLLATFLIEIFVDNHEFHEIYKFFELTIRAIKDTISHSDFFF